MFANTCLKSASELVALLNTNTVHTPRNSAHSSVLSPLFMSCWLYATSVLHAKLPLPPVPPILQVFIQKCFQTSVSVMLQNQITVHALHAPRNPAHLPLLCFIHPLFDSMLHAKHPLAYHNISQAVISPSCPPTRGSNGYTVSSFSLPHPLTPAAA